MKKTYDVLIIGGGPAGLSAAMSLVRMQRSVLLCDDNRPRNKPAEHMNNFVSHDGLNPMDWRTSAKKDLEKYPTIDFCSMSVSTVEQTHKGFSILIGSKEVFCRKIVLAYGVQDLLLEIPGMTELWGKSVYHCPYCHGYEVKHSKLGLIANDKFAEHLVPMIYSLSSDLILFTNGQSRLDEKLKSQLKKNNLQIIEHPLKSLFIENNQLKAIVLENNDLIPRDGIFIAPKLPFQTKSTIGQHLSCKKNDMGFYSVDSQQRTTTSGVFAAGDITTPMHSVIAAMASGQVAGAAAASELVQEDFYFV